MTQEQALELCKPYNGQQICDIGNHLKDKSVYNCNVYRLPNGTEIKVVSHDDEYQSEVYLQDGSIDRYVGIAEDTDNDKLVWTVTDWFPT